ncbi:MAG TPA: ribose 5-phosphate isomerase B [Chondromyces sp.]|nr:ribose 5-phosphate isomerase B [Chondromyces sp.]
MKIALGCDHGGFHLKEAIKKHLEANDYEVTDVGTYSTDSVDFPNYALQVCQSVTKKESDYGILCCGTGIGMSIAANKNKGILASVVSDTFSAKATKEHNNGNVLCLGERVIGEGLALTIVDTWLQAEFQGGRHENRVNQVRKMEQTLC